MIQHLGQRGAFRWQLVRELAAVGDSSASKWARQKLKRRAARRKAKREATAA